MLCDALQAVVPLDVWISGGFAKLPTAPEQEYVAMHRERLAGLVNGYLQPALDQLATYAKYQSLLPGAEATRDLEAFLQTEHSFEEYLAVSHAGPTRLTHNYSLTVLTCVCVKVFSLRS